MFSKAFISLMKVLHYFYKGSFSRVFSLIAPNCGCRFSPSCSDYYLESSQRFGVLRGLLLGSKRFLRCSGLSDGGYDPVPELKK